MWKIADDPARAAGVLPHGRRGEGAFVQRRAENHMSQEKWDSQGKTVLQRWVAILVSSSSGKMSIPYIL